MVLIIKMRICLYIILFFISGCTSVASSTAALVVALHSDKLEKDTRRYKGIDRCFVDGKQGPVEIGYKIFNTPSFAGEYQVILNPELKKIENYPPKDVSYAYFYIASRMHDKRAGQYLDLIRPYLSPQGRHKEIEEFIDLKYLQSHLTKCFDVPNEHQVRLKDKELLRSR